MCMLEVAMENHQGRNLNVKANVCNLKILRRYFIWPYFFINLMRAREEEEEYSVHEIPPAKLCFLLFASQDRKTEQEYFNFVNNLKLPLG